MYDPILIQFEKIWKKYVGEDIDPRVKIGLLSDIRQACYAVRVGNMDFEEFRQFVKDMLSIVLGDKLDEETINKIVEELEKAVRVEVTRGRFIIPKRFSFT